MSLPCGGTLPDCAALSGTPMIPCHHALCFTFTGLTVTCNLYSACFYPHQTESSMRNGTMWFPSLTQSLEGSHKVAVLDIPKCLRLATKKKKKKSKACIGHSSEAWAIAWMGPRHVDAFHILGEQMLCERMVWKWKWSLSVTSDSLWPHGL